MQIRIFTEKLCIVLIICGAMFLIAGWISDWLWQGMFAAIYGQHTGDTGIAGMATDPVIIGEYATLKPRINLVMYLIPLDFLCTWLRCYCDRCCGTVTGYYV